MRSTLMLAGLLLTPLGAGVAQGTSLPETPQGRLVAAFFSAANAPDEEALFRFQEANFSEAALKRRSAQERRNMIRQLRTDAGQLRLREVRSASPTRIVVAATGSGAPGLVLSITFSFTMGEIPKIEAMEITG